MLVSRVNVDQGANIACSLLICPPARRPPQSLLFVLRSLHVLPPQIQQSFHEPLEFEQHVDGLADRRVADRLRGFDFDLPEGFGVCGNWFFGFGVSLYIRAAHWAVRDVRGSKHVCGWKAHGMSEGEMCVPAPAGT